LSTHFAQESQILLHFPVAGNRMLYFEHYLQKAPTGDKKLEEEFMQGHLVKHAFVRMILTRPTRRSITCPHY